MFLFFKKKNNFLNHGKALRLYISSMYILYFLYYLYRIMFNSMMHIILLYIYILDVAVMECFILALLKILEVARYESRELVPTRCISDHYIWSLKNPALIQLLNVA